MKPKIFKYEFEIKDEFTVKAPPCIKMLAVQLQREVPCFWMLVDADGPEATHQFRLLGTGHPFDDYLGQDMQGYYPRFDFVGTFQVTNFHMMSRGLVFHLFKKVAS